MLRSRLMLVLAAVMQGVLLLPLTAEVDTPSATGTGFVVNAAGYLVTCAHVVKNTARVKVLLGGQKYLATVERIDEAHDLALLKIPRAGLAPLAISDVTLAEKGLAVRAFGYPLTDLVGEDLKVSGGMISGVAPAEHGDWWQIDAAVNPGNSGGPLTDTRGAVLGVVNAKLRTDIAGGINFVVPVTEVRDFLHAAGVGFSTTAAEKVDDPALVRRVAPSVALIYAWTKYTTGLRGDGPGAICIHPEDDAEMIWVPAGDFLMGSADTDPLADPEEKPQHTVYLTGYWIYKYPVTVKQWAQFCAANWGINIQPGPDDNLPAANITWDGAYLYARSFGATLPTEAQWEKAARGTDGRIYPWGDTWDALKCVTLPDNFENRKPVGSFPSGVSPYGVQEMVGSVEQWCADWYAADYYQHTPDRNPLGPATGTKHVIHGGSWYDDSPKYHRAALRQRDFYNTRDPKRNGFRCVADPAVEEERE